MGLLDGLIGGAVGAEMISVVNGLIEKHGGVKGLVAQFQQQGLGPTIQSWVGNGENLPISPEQVHQALGSDTVQQLATKLGIPPNELAAKQSQVLPQAVDKMTPNGTASKAPCPAMPPTPQNRPVRSMYGTACGPCPGREGWHFLARDAIEGDVGRARNWHPPDARSIEAAPHSRVLAQLLDGCNDQGQHRLRGGGVLISNVGRDGVQIAGAARRQNHFWPSYL